MSASQAILLGGGCFWCLDAVYRGVRGVTRVVSGYAGGAIEAPSYKAVCGGTTGHVEVVAVTFDPDAVSLEDLLRIFFTIHDPTTPDRQGADVGTQYRSVIFHDGDAQRDAAAAVMREVTEAGVWGAPLVTALESAPRFWPAEEEHQDYFVRNPWSGYCRAVVAPKVAKFRKGFAGLMRDRAAA